MMIDPTFHCCRHVSTHYLHRSLIVYFPFLSIEKLSSHELKLSSISKWKNDEN